MTKESKHSKSSKDRDEEGKDKKAHKHESKHKKEHRDKDKKSKRHKEVSLERRYDGPVTPISEDDYFTKSTEFRTWLHRALQTNFEDLTSKEAHSLFKQFVSAYNAGALDAMYYSTIPLELRRAVGTAHRWAIRLSEADAVQLSDLAEDVDHQTRRPL